VILDYFVGLAMYHGHPPDQARSYAWRDLQLMAIVTDALADRHPNGGTHG